MSPTLEINKKTVTLTNLKKELWPGEGIDKYHLIKYYLEISSYMLPHLKDRFLVFRRFPEGINGKGFFQKNCPQGAPPWIKTVPFKHSGDKVTNYILATGPESLTWLGNQACLEIHQWLSSVSTLENPDFAVFDLDPMEGITFPQVCTVALALHDLLKKSGLRGYPKTSGSRGIQVYLPLLPGYSYDHSRKFCEDVFKELFKLFPAISTLERKVSERGTKIYLDYLQNARGKTLVAPYSPRPLPGAPVSTPLEWSEIAASSFLPSSFQIKNILPRLQKKGDLFAPVLKDRQRIPFNI
ncbi:MAG: DNA polymerase domain-containing protein [Dethiobacter sp.]|jgi:bifunctional non-homologous end joining protein LigD|nr:MAG: DNA polymerase domain-containing protein [Dethiobacter sp.]